MRCVYMFVSAREQNHRETLQLCAILHSVSNNSTKLQNSSFFVVSLTFKFSNKKESVCRIKYPCFISFAVKCRLAMFAGGAAEKAGVRQGDVIFKVRLVFDSSLPYLRLKLMNFLC